MNDENSIETPIQSGLNFLKTNQSTLRFNIEGGFEWVIPHNDEDSWKFALAINDRIEQFCVTFAYALQEVCVRAQNEGLADISYINKEGQRICSLINPFSPDNGCPVPVGARFLVITPKNG